MDVISEGGMLFLATRMRRLAERLQADVAQVSERAGVPVQPGQYAILAALDRTAPVAVGELAQALGLAQPAVTRTLAALAEKALVEIVRDCSDQRLRRHRLTGAGRTALMRAKLLVWPQVRAAAEAVAGGLTGPLLAQIATIETRIAATPLAARAAQVAGPALRVVDWRADRAAAFKAINEEWISAMFTLEPTDIAVLNDPHPALIAPGGDILFVEAEGVGLIGACALKKTGPDAYELTKMGVYEAARGLRAGDLLLQAVIARAKAKGAKSLYLLSNKKNVAAVRLYEKHGFVHSDAIMKRYGAVYARCDVAMDYPLL